ncbi:hypothetical protein EW146_g9850 [Bondarzewia mesenterica]|uniref:C3H1-type domain-containing protein n=1 Tax=Bondarzewia mesenterica TaxID=1095465 RepID=A0A4S4L2Y1_9AGAM|nr:hypothetical protein EW146_g9850 [Bondarzewia mesenterica]
MWSEVIVKIQEIAETSSIENTRLVDRVKELEVELSVWKQAHAALHDAAERKNKARGEPVDTAPKKQTNDINLSGVVDKNLLVLCVVDGTKSIFSTSYIKDGEEGGRRAAQELIEGIHDHLADDKQCTSRDYSLWISVYINKRGTKKDLVANGRCSGNEFESFCEGLSQSSPSLVIIDVVTRSGADKKINGRFWTQTPSLILEGLFMDSVFPARVSSTTPSLFSRHPSTADDERSLLQSPSDSNTRKSTVIDPTLPLYKRASSIVPLSARQKAHLPFSENPPPCNEHYLLDKCSKGTYCKYSHDYLLTTEQLRTLGKNAKQSPCWFMNNGKECPYGEHCCWGHSCPFGVKCFFSSKDRCRFKGLSSCSLLPHSEILDHFIQEEDDFEVNNTPGYKPSAAKTVDEYTKLDAEDESLARWKASLGLGTGATFGDTSKPKVEVLTLELVSPSLPQDKKITVDLKNRAQLAQLKSAPIQVKEGEEYSVQINFLVNHSIVTGLRYIQVVKRKGIKVAKVDSMLGSYGAQADPRNVTVVQDEFPSGLLARGEYNVKSRVTDIDGEVYAEWEWMFKIGKECRPRQLSTPSSRIAPSWYARKACLSPRRTHTKAELVHPTPPTPKTWVDRLPVKIANEVLKFSRDWYWGEKEFMDSSKYNVDLSVSAAPIPPALDNTLVVSRDFKVPVKVRMVGLDEEDAYDEFKADSLCPSNVSIVCLPTRLEFLSAPTSRDPNANPHSRACIREGLGVCDCDWAWDLLDQVLAF